MEARDDVVRYRLRRAREALEDARVLANASRWSACVNRLYYACFYADQVQPWIAGAEQLVEHVASLIEGHGE